MPRRSPLRVDPMAGLLDGQISRAIYAGFRGKLLKGKLRRSQNAVSGGLDSLGDPAAASPEDYTLEGFREEYSAFYRSQAGIPTEDVRIIVLARSLSVAPRAGDQVQISGQWYRVRQVRTDPATATYDLQSFALSS